MARQRKPKVRYKVSGYYGTGLRGQRNRGILITSRSNYAKAYQVTGRGRNKQYKDISRTAKGRDIRTATGIIQTSSRRYGAYAMLSGKTRGAYGTLQRHGAMKGLGVTYSSQRGMQRRIARSGRQRRVRRNYRGQFAGSY